MRPWLPSPQSLPAPPLSVRQSTTYTAPSGPETIWHGRNSGSADFRNSISWVTANEAPWGATL